MAGNEGFSHITVNADGDDDVVIQAGIVEASDDVTVDSPVAEEAPSELDGDSEAVFASPADDGGGETAGAAPSRTDDGYRETTLSDIQDSKMSGTQKAVIALAVLGIIAFVLWYLLAH